MPPSAPIRKIRPIQLVAVIFFTVSGGPYGLEPLISYAGQHAALLVLLITPLLWDVPAIFTVLELNSMMPVTGGYYQWVKHALGKRWGFYEGWWTWLYTFIDLAIYPALFVTYLSFFYPEVAPYHYWICLGFIWFSALLNIFGIVPVGKTALVLGVIVLVPFLILFGIAFSHHAVTTFPSQSLHGLKFSNVGMALYTVMWNCLGWDNVTTYAEEVEKPVKSYLYSTFTAFGLVIVLYFLIILISQQTGIDTKALQENAFPAIGVAIAGKWLGALIAIAGMASSFGIYAAVLLSVSRVPKVMADDELLPKKLNSTHSKFGSPYVSIIVCSAIVSLMTIWPLGDLFVIDVTVYGAGLSLEYISLIKLRLSEPDTLRPFKIPLNVFWLCALLILPFGVYFIALTAQFSSSDGPIWAAIFAIVLLATAELAWWLVNIKQSPLRESAKHAAYYILLATTTTWTVRFFDVASFDVVKLLCYVIFIICLLRGQKIYRERLGGFSFGRALYAGLLYTVLSAFFYTGFLYLLFTFFPSHIIPVRQGDAGGLEKAQHALMMSAITQYLIVTLALGLLLSVLGFFIWRKNTVDR